MSIENKNGLVVGHQIQIDRSGGQGHCRKDVTAEELGYSLSEEIAGEIIDGGVEECDDIVIGGQHYRWS